MAASTLAPPQAFPWKLWTNGKLHTIYQGIDFDDDLPVMQHKLWKRGENMWQPNHCYRVRTVVDEVGASISFVFIRLEKN